MKPITREREKEDVSPQSLLQSEGGLALRGSECMLMTRRRVTLKDLMVSESAAFIAIAWKFRCQWRHVFAPFRIARNNSGAGTRERTMWEEVLMLLQLLPLRRQGERSRMCYWAF